MWTYIEKCHVIKKCHAHATLTAQYEGKFCLQKAALKALRSPEKAGNSSNPLRRLSRMVITAMETRGYVISTHLRRSKSSNALSPCKLFVTRILSSDAPQLFHLSLGPNPTKDDVSI